MFGRATIRLGIGPHSSFMLHLQLIWKIKTQCRKIPAYIRSLPRRCLDATFWSEISQSAENMDSHAETSSGPTMFNNSHRSNNATQ